MKIMKKNASCVVLILSLVGLLWSQNPGSVSDSSLVALADSTGGNNFFTYASQYRWSETPTNPKALVAGNNIVTLSPCPRGFMVAPYPGKSEGVSAHEYVYIAGTGGPESAQIHRISGHAGAATCSFAVMLNGDHPAGYRVETATGGIKEASEDATILAEPYGFGIRRKQGGMVVLDVA